MAIYHLEAKVVSRGTGRSAVAAAAYMSCSKIYNDYDGVQHDYTRKKGLVWEQVFLPECAPTGWQDRAALWNAVEENEKTKDSRLAREFVVALPVKLDKEQWIHLLTNYIKRNFVVNGMCADVAIHDTDGHNPHAHIMLTVRPLNRDGTWQYKTEKEYLCIKDGEERGFTASEFKTAQADGWEKQYKYKVGKKKVYMPPSEAEKHGYERVNKYPKSTKYGRQNPISERWNSDEQLILWREAWAEISNRYLEQAGRVERIAHRSHADRGLDEQPTVHEGVVARALEQKGIISDRCELNRQIKADNALLRELKAAVKKLTQAVKNTIPAITEALETVRQNVLIFCYQLRHIRGQKEQIQEYVSSAKSEIRHYSDITEHLKETSKKRKVLLTEKKAVPFWNISKQKELSAKITELTEQLEELRSEKAILLKQLQCADDPGISTAKQNVSVAEQTLKKLEQQEEKYSFELEIVLRQYSELKEQSEAFDPVEVYKARQEIRSRKAQETSWRVQSAYGERYSLLTMLDSKRDAVALLGEEKDERLMREALRVQQKQGMDASAPQRKQRQGYER